MAYSHSPVGRSLGLKAHYLALDRPQWTSNNLQLSCPMQLHSIDFSRDWEREWITAFNQTNIQIYVTDNRWNELPIYIYTYVSSLKYEGELFQEILRYTFLDQMFQFRDLMKKSAVDDCNWKEPRSNMTVHISLQTTDLNKCPQFEFDWIYAAHIYPFSRKAILSCIKRRLQFCWSLGILYFGLMSMWKVKMS